ncbi:MAG: hypothetical protein IID37_16230 [Planctomycetes bacterium]|nr:hypothetical protein [Planctomycetota bacterium]
MKRTYANRWVLTCLAGVWASPVLGHVQLNYPNGGEQLEVGSVVTVEWQILISHSLLNWDLWYSTTGSNGPWIVVAVDLPPGSGSVGSIHTYEWTVPDTLTSQGRVRVLMDNTGTDYEDISNSDFSILLEVDHDPPSPDPMTFDSLPAPLGTMEMTMTATEATDDSPPIEYMFDFVIGGLGGSDSAWQESTTYVDAGLFPNSNYTYRVKARDGLNPANETDWSDEHEAATEIETPRLLFAIATSSSSIDVVVLDPLTNLTLGSSGVYFDSTTDGGDVGLNEWIQTILDTATGLEPDALYTFRVKARNQDGVETEYGPETSKATLANVPGAPALDALTCDSMDIDLDENGNPSITSFAIQCTATDPSDATWDGMYVDAAGEPTMEPAWQTSSDWGTVTALGLSEATTYAYQVAALNQDGVETEFGPASSAATGVCGACEGDANGDGTVDPLDSGFVLARFGCPVGEGDPSCDEADQNGDGAVDPLDVGFVLARFGPCD